ncbi:hypothetical protein DIZ81_11375 [Legionella taurinensis]|uniref:Uncharacterized protein n=2 Tax=Legionella taurinensis TaxID=70611 RepID=A0A3A5LHK0_9GAMM|nr:hypothetical protein [Legionella taurinensis]MDX1838559.1 hypothetical protein [Legionella taurinensis]PUT39005.1 hypothetical protein DB744_11385 [Legionella taurinensis]PUT41092.1 hypothetical protein DB746_09775 [Legionella taurinensis]PUT43467.1 hypothetical protein DB743_10780 [Legionella taurinensis]PUT46484.1 hypothetical protein DB745_10265 [Legionella taurinensis]
MSESEVFELVYPRQLNLSVLLNGTRRWYLTQQFEKPPEAELNHAELLDLILINMADLFKSMAHLGVYRIFAPAYSKVQPFRDKPAHKSLLNGIVNLHRHEALLALYQQMEFKVYFPGDLSFLPETKAQEMKQFSKSTLKNKRHVLYYDLNYQNSYNYLFKLAYDFSQIHHRPPTWEDMVELYYDDKALGELNILICNGRFYGRTGIPPLMGNLSSERIYATAVSPLLMTPTVLRRILYDYLYVNPPQGVHYRDISQDDLLRLKVYYEANKDKLLGLTQEYGQFIYPLEELVLPNAFFNPRQLN